MTTVEKWLGDENTLGIDIWRNKYQYEEETFDEWLDRVSNGDNKLRKLIEEKKFLFGGRILANRGLHKRGKKITYSNCFIKGSKVITDYGLTNIENVKIGDMVLSDDGNFHKVNNVLSRDYVGNLYKFSSYEMYEPIICTPNHKILTNHGWKRADNVLACSKQVKTQDKFKTACYNNTSKMMSNGQGKTVDITEGFKTGDDVNILFLDNDKIRINKRFKDKNVFCWRAEGNIVNRYILFDDDFMYFVGRWLGDGSITRRKGNRNHSILQIVFNATTEREGFEHCKNIGEKIFGISASTRETRQNVLVLRFESELIASWFYRTFGEKCDGKHIPLEFLGNRNIMKGLCDSDGMINTHGAFKITLKNKQMIEWLRDTMYINGINASEIKSVNGHEETYSLNVSVAQSNRNLNPLLSKTYHDKRQNKVNFTMGEYAVISNVEILEDKETTVYNLSVEDTHTYTVNGIVVHNCYVLSEPEDNIESIFECAKKLARTFSYGGGCGIDISKLSPKGAKINNAAKETSGAVSFMDLYSMITGLIGQGGRRGALMLSIDCSHPDLEDFIGIKSDLDRVTKANISVKMSNEFMNAVQNDEDYTLKFTRVETGENIIKTVRAKELFKKLCEMNWDMAEPGILFWDNITGYNLMSNTEDFRYAGTNPCAEEPLPPGGSCLLGSINLNAFVDKNNKIFNFDEFKNAVKISVKALNDVLDEGLPLHPLQEQRDSVRDWRQIGLGIMGIADMLINMGITYGSDESIKLCDEIGFVMANTAIKTSAKLAKEYGAFPKCKTNNIITTDYFINNTDEKTRDLVMEYGLRNSQILTIAPTGSISTMLQISGGIEPIFANYYTRRTESLHNETVEYKVYTPIVKEYMDSHNISDDKYLPEFFITAQNLDYKNRVDMQSVWQKHIDASISSTVNLPHETTIEQVEELYSYAWEKGLKGITVYRDGCKRSGILTTDNTKTDDKPFELSRGDIIEVNDDVVGKKRKLTTGCGSLHCSAFFDPATGELLETYFSKGSTGGCNNFMIGLSRMISLLARSGVDINSIVEQLNSCGACPSYAVRHATKKDTSKGSCCPVAIGYALLDMYKEMQAEINDETIKEEHDSQKPKCPECGEDLTFEGGCNICKSCGWSKCD